MIERDPAYGHIVCFCERVTEGEVRDALAATVPAVDLGGLRRRTRATNGRCQGFWCGALIAARLASPRRHEQEPADGGRAGRRWRPRRAGRRHGR